jgi:cephalosporin hydroxylase
MIQVAYADNKIFTEAIMPTMWLLKHFSLKEFWINLEYNGLPLMKNFLFLIVYQMVIIEL